MAGLLIFLCVHFFLAVHAATEESAVAHHHQAHMSLRSSGGTSERGLASLIARAGHVLRADSSLGAGLASAPFSGVEAAAAATYQAAKVQQAKLSVKAAAGLNATVTTTMPVSAFVAIFSARVNSYRRTFARKTMTGLDKAFTTKFIVCENVTNKELQAEAKAKGDIVLLDCAEGVERTLLTKKMHEALKLFRKEYKEKHYFMKVDDDTFVAWRKLSRFLGDLSDTDRLSDFAYMGVSKPAGVVVNRNSDSVWYQPHDQYPNNTWPAYMAAGSGYILGAALVRRIIDLRIAEPNLLSNEDQAVGVWVHLAKQSGAPVKFVDIPGTSGCIDAHSCAGQWEDYPYILHHRLKGEFLHCLSKFDAAASGTGNIDACFVDSVFVAVFSRRDLASAARRVLLRDMLKNAGKGAAIANVAVKFALCAGTDADTPRLKAETSENGDIIFLPCEEGYTRTLLTKKLVMAMQAYRRDFSDKALFMKVDDDTFVSWKRLAKYVSTQFGSEFAYMGIPCPEGREVNRDSNSLWYQPESDYAGLTYPSTMEGGPGYILGSELVRRILDDGVAVNHVLSNEDQAAGVWVEELKKLGVPVAQISIPGTDGYKPAYDSCHGTWKSYPYMLHHKLDANSISCLAKVEAADDDEGSIESCFPECQRLTAERLDDSLVRLGEEVTDTMGKLQTMGREMETLSEGLKWLLTKSGNTKAATGIAPAASVHERAASPLSL